MTEETQQKRIVSHEEYMDALLQRQLLDQRIRTYEAERQTAVHLRAHKLAEPFKDDELVYSRENRCNCGAGLAYPKGCGPFHYWRCSAQLKTAGGQVPGLHSNPLPFGSYEIKAENAAHSTRPKAGEQ